jgi:hypothetical protein
MFENTPFIKATTILYTLTSFTQLYYSRTHISYNFLLRVLLLHNSQPVEQILGTTRLFSIALITSSISSIFTQSPFIAISTTLLLLFNSLIPTTNKYALGGKIPIDNKTITNIIAVQILFSSGYGMLWRVSISMGVTLGYFAIPKLREWRVPGIVSQGLELINSTGYAGSDRVHERENQARFVSSSV